MHIQPNDPDNATVDGGDLTEEEARLVAEGVEEKATEAGDDVAGDDAGAAGDAAGAGDDAAAAAAAAADAEAAAAAAAASQVQHAAPDLPAKPEPPKDFAAEIAAAEQEYEAGNLDAVQLNRRTRELTLEEADYRADVRAWERQTAELQETVKQRAEDDWNNTALAFETANKEFLSNPLRHKYMQDSINLVLEEAQRTGQALTNQGVLDKALKIAKDFTGYKDPDPVPGERDAVGNALKDRRQALPDKTLGDVPASRSEAISGNEGFASLDGMAIPELEVAYANMTPAQQEAYLRDAPGANANGRE